MSVFTYYIMYHRPSASFLGNGLRPDISAKMWQGTNSIKKAIRRKIPANLDIQSFLNDVDIYRLHIDPLAEQVKMHPVYFENWP